MAVLPPQVEGSLPIQQLLQARNTQKDEKAGEMKNKVPIEDGPAMSSANSTASNSTASGGGRWGEQNIADVNVEQAYDDFEDLRRELSRPRRVSTTRSNGRRLSVHDEEEGEHTSDSTFVDLEEYLQRVHRDATASGITPKRIGVRFRNLTVQGSGSGSIFVRTFGDEMMGLFGKNVYDLLKMFLPGPKPTIKNIISGFSGVVKPGEMLLVLGRPGSGSSTFLRALTNQRRDFTAIHGDVDYSGLGFEVAKHRYRGEILYNDEEDIHLPTLTVGQTVKFALKTKTPSKRIPGTSRTEFVDQMLELFAKMFGMKHVLNTIVGNQFARGVSGGERKRVSIMEALASRATINAYDNSTRGLDSSTAVDYIRSLRILSSISKSTTVVTLYQAGEQIYREFDKVCLIYSGRQIFYGKASEARGYFEQLGFEFPVGSTTADYLTSITDPHEKRIKPGYEGKVPSTPEELEAAFRNSQFWGEVQKELIEYDGEIEGDAEKFSKAVREDKSKIASKGSPYTVSFPMQVWYLTEREFQLQWQDKTGLRNRAINVIVVALLIGSLFFQIPRTSEGAYSMGGALFLNIVVVGWMQLIEAINMTVGRPITAKQKAFAFYRPSAEVIAKTIADLPILAIQCSFFTMVLYFMADLWLDAGRFFLQLLFVFTTTICMTAFYRSIGSFSKDVSQTLQYAFFGLNMVALFAGYMQTQFTMKSWVYRWLFFATPVSYALEALMVNQFDGMDMTCSPHHLIPGVPGADIANQVCFLPSSEQASATVSGTKYIREQFGYERAHVWRNYGILWVFTLGYLAVAMFCVEYLTFGAGGGATKVFVKRWGASKSLKKSTTELPISNKTERDVDRDSVEPQAVRHITTSRAANPSIFTWTDINYTINTGTAKEQKLLNNISGYVKPGRLTALMGPSGAGKTTLLNTLSQRMRVGTVTGKAMIDGKPLRPDFERSTAYVEQMDIHDGTATVREALRFSAELRQPANVPKEEKYQFVEDIIRLLELENIADALIGHPGFGLSVEERKRVTIGVELAAKPDTLLFLDEPTSGLDSMGALSIVRFLRKLADESNLAILCTIHQPSAILFQDFDDILLVARGGQEVYFGPIGNNGEQAVGYFERNGAPKMAEAANPAEYILETTRPKHNRDWPTIWANSPEAASALREIAEIEESRAPLPELRTERSLEYAMPLSIQIQAVTARLWRHYWRNPSYGFSKIFSNLSMAILGGILFFDSGNTIIEMQSRGFGAFLLTILYPATTASSEAMFLNLRMLYESRERNSKIYSANAFITAMIICEIPYSILGSVFFFLPWFYMIGFPNSSANAGYMFFLVTLFQIFMPPFGMLIASFVPDMTTASIVNPFIFVATNGFTGILVPFEQLPKFYSSWVYWVNPVTWVVRGVMASAIHSVEVECGQTELVTFQPPQGQTCGEYAGEWSRAAFGELLNMDATSDCNYCPFKNGDEYLQTVNIDNSTKWRDLGIFTIYLFSTTILIYVVHWAVREQGIKKFLKGLRKPRA